MTNNNKKIYSDSIRHKGKTMKHEGTSKNTKLMLAASLKKIMEDKPFSKITISDIVNDSDVNRKTFYYHFDDIGSLMKWMLEQEAIEVVKNFDLMVDHEDAINFVIDYIEKNEYMINGIYDSMGREGMKKFLYDDFIGLLDAFIRNVEEDFDATLEDDFRFFLCQFYAEAIAGMIINLFRDKIEISKEKVIDYITRIFSLSLPNIISNNSDMSKK